MNELPDSDGSHNAQLLKVRNRQINAVHTISRELSSTLDLDERLEHILTVSMNAVEALAGSILLYRTGDDKLVFRHVVGPNSAKLIDFAMNAGDGIAGSVFQSGEGRITNKPLDTGIHRQDISKEVTGFATESIVTVPLKYEEGQPIGVMQILNKLTGEFNESDLEVLEILASIAAAAIQNAQLHRDAQLSAVAHTVGDVSHDIKNKISPIKIGADSLREWLRVLYQSWDEASHAEKVLDSGALQDHASFLRDNYDEILDMMLDQVEEVQVYTKIIADALKGIITEPELIPNELTPIVSRQLDQLESSARSRGVELVRRIEDVPPFRFDKFLIERAVFNLVNNAIPETPRGGSVTVTTGIVKEEDGEYVFIDVADTGRGMPPHVMERILRGDAKSTKPGGSGLGTKIVHNAVAAHKGKLEGASEEGVGSRFRIKLPFRP